MIDIDRFLNDVPISVVLNHFNIHREGKLYSCPFHGKDVHPSASILGRKLYCFQERHLYDAADIVQHFGIDKPYKYLAELAKLNLDDYSYEENSTKKKIIEKKTDAKNLIAALGIKNNEVRVPYELSESGRKIYSLSPERTYCDKANEETLSLSPFSELDEAAQLYVIGKSFKRRIKEAESCKDILENVITDKNREIVQAIEKKENIIKKEVREYYKN